MTAGPPDASWPHLAGRLTGSGHILPVRVYFEDTDHSGVVYHAAYLRFMERGRSDFVRLLGIGHTELARGDHGEPVSFAVRKIDIDFLRPARIDDLLEVETTVGEMGGARIALRQVVRRGGEVLTDAAVTIVLINPEGKARRLPPFVRERFAAAAPVTTR